MNRHVSTQRCDIDGDGDLAPPSQRRGRECTSRSEASHDDQAGPKPATLCERLDTHSVEPGTLSCDHLSVHPLTSLALSTYFASLPPNFSIVMAPKRSSSPLDSDGSSTPRSNVFTPVKKPKPGPSESKPKRVRQPLSTTRTPTIPCLRPSHPPPPELYYRYANSRPVDRAEVLDRRSASGRPPRTSSSPS